MMVKENFLENWGKHNVSLAMSNVKNTNKIEGFMVDNIEEYHYESDE